jgi:hypothetical protein
MTTLYITRNYLSSLLILSFRIFVEKPSQRFSAFFFNLSEKFVAPCISREIITMKIVKGGTAKAVYGYYQEGAGLGVPV